MTTVTAYWQDGRIVRAHPTCEARVGFHPGDYGTLPLYCNATIGLTQWTDLSGRTHRACRWHVAELIRRSPERYVSEIADDPLGQAKAAAERPWMSPEDQHGTPCHHAGHVPGCAGQSGGDHELLPGWISYDEDGNLIEVEVAP